MSAAADKIAADAVAGGDPALVALITTSLGLLHVLQVYTSCMITLAVWEWLVCLKLEWERIWKREWNLVKVLYIWTRYYGLLCFSLNLWLFNGAFTFERCKTLHYLIAATCMWTSLGSEAILAVRTYAFLGKKMWVGATLAAMLLGETAFLLYVSIAAVTQVPIAIGDTGPCTASDAPGKHIVTGFWLAPVCFDLICTFLTLFKAIQLKNGGVKSPIVRIFIREGIFYFMAVSAFNVLNAIFMFQSNASIQNINSFLALIMSQVLCCRLVLNLRTSNNASHNNYSSSQTAEHTSRNAPKNPTVNIPLNNFRAGPVDDHVGVDSKATSNDLGLPYSGGGVYGGHPYGSAPRTYGDNDPRYGIKVQVDVERDLERSD